MTRIVTFLLLAAAALASARSYTVKLLEPATFGSTELKAGEYKLEVDGDTAVIRGGKLHGESPVKVENVDQKYDQTTVRYETSNGKMKIREIHLGGTKTRLVFSM